MLLNQPNEFTDARFGGVKAKDIRAELVHAYEKGFRIIFIVGAVLAALSVVIVVLLMPQVSLDHPDDETLKLEGKKASERKS